MKLDAKMVEKVSKEGNPYVCIEVKITDTYTKMIFLTQAEKELIRAVLSNKAN